MSALAWQSRRWSLAAAQKSHQKRLRRLVRVHGVTYGRKQLLSNGGKP